MNTTPATPIDSPAKRKLFDVCFINTNKSGFHRTLKKRVNAYFNENQLSRYCDTKMVLKTFFYVFGWLAIYALIMLFDFSLPIKLGLAVLLGFFLTGIGFNIGHDAIHGAYAKTPFINKIACMAFEFIGASTYTWKIRHNIIHHTYTNVIGSDGDLESMPLLRFCVKPGRRWFHAYQHWYAPFLYSFVTIVWLVKKDFKHIFEERREQRLNCKPPKRIYLFILLGKLFHIGIFFVAPLFLFQIKLSEVILIFFTMHFAAGLFMSVVFQLGHSVEGPEFLQPPKDCRIEDSWAEHQMKTCSNFGSGPLVTWVCGGLNFQVEHHLFPSICHTHYPAISKIVQATAQEYELPYYDQKNIFAAIGSHFRMLKYFGRTDPSDLATAL